MGKKRSLVWVVFLFLLAFAFVFSAVLNDFKLIGYFNG